MKVHEISDVVKERIGPAGDLYLTRSRTADLICWLELTERMWREQVILIDDLQRVIVRLKSDMTKEMGL